MKKLSNPPGLNSFDGRSSIATAKPVAADFGGQQYETPRQQSIEMQMDNKAINPQPAPELPPGINGSSPDRTTPGSMHMFERSWAYQLVLLMFLFAISVSNSYINFEMLTVYETTISQLKTIADSGIVIDNQTEIEVLLGQANATQASCDIQYFSVEQQASVSILLDVFKKLHGFMKASAFISAVFVIPFTYLIKVIASLHLAFDDFHIVPTEELVERNIIGKRQKKFDLIRTKAVAESIIQESEGERKIRVFLRSDTILFMFAQMIQDIPQATGAIFYLLLIVRERGVFCLENFFNTTVGTVGDLNAVDNVAFGQLSIIGLSVFANFVVNLAPRWVRYFYHQQAKLIKNPQGLGTIIMKVSFFTVVYLIGAMLPLLAMLYSPLGEELLGMKTTGEPVILVFLIISAVALGVGGFWVCCFWGNRFGEKICVCAVIFEAGLIGLEACCAVETVGMIGESCCP